MKQVDTAAALLFTLPVKGRAKSKVKWLFVAVSKLNVK